MPTIERHIAVEAVMTAIDLLANAAPLSRGALKRAMKNGCVWIEDGKGVRRLRRAQKTLQPGQRLHLYYDENIMRQAPLPARLIADEGAYSVWNKPAGMFSQGGKWGDHCSLYRFAETSLLPQRPAFLVHRLDRAASGLMLLAHSKRVAQAFAELFARRAVNKQYRVCVDGCFEPAQLPLIIDTPLDGKPARTRLLVFNYDSRRDQTCLQLAIDSGRKHQIRRHLAGLGHPVCGDRLYGSTRLDCDLQLQAVKLAFRCPLSGDNKNYEIHGEEPT